MPFCAEILSSSDQIQCRELAHEQVQCRGGGYKWNEVGFFHCMWKLNGPPLGLYQLLRVLKTETGA